jgi:mono/diheme cytochrome c family protein
MILALASLLAVAAAVPQKARPTTEVYKTYCQACHMADGNSVLEPMNFADGVWKHGNTPEKVAGVIANGVPGSAMLPFKAKLNPAEVRALAEYVRAFDPALKAPPKTGTK